MKKILLLLFITQCVSAATDYKIYDTLQVKHNTLHLEILDFKNQTISGKAEIQLESKINNLQYIPILLQNMQIDSVWVNSTLIKNIQYDSTLVRIPVITPLKKGENALLTIKYQGKPTGSSFGGLVINSSLRRAHNMGASLTEIPHSYARSWYPATDDFRSRSTFDLYYRIDSDLKAISTGVFQDTIPHANGTTTWHWRVNQAIPDYLVAIAVGEYEQIHYDYQQSSRTLPIDVYAFPQEAEAARETYAIVPDILKYMEKHFGEMVFDRIGFVCAYGTGGAMEHVDNITMPSNPQPDTDYQMLVIHELIHSWFGNQVTCATAEDMWLNEGITSFLTGVIIEELFPAKVAADYWKSCMANALILAPTYENEYIPIYPMPTSHTYGPTVYMKGAMVMSTLRNVLGEEVLFSALKKYLTTYSLQSVTTEEFLAFMSQATGKDLSAFFRQWIYTPGFMGFEIDSIKGTYNGTDYKGILSVEQKLCGATQYGKGISVPITFFDKTETINKKVSIEIDGARTDTEINLSFEPAFAIIDADYQICKASMYEAVQIDSAATYNSRHCNAAIQCKTIEKPFKVYLEFCQVTPDPFKKPSDIQLYPDYYWRLNGQIPTPSQVSGQFRLSMGSLSLSLLQDSGKPVLLLFRPTPADDWKQIHSVPFSVFSKEGITAESLISGEYCLGF